MNGRSGVLGGGRTIDKLGKLGLRDGFSTVKTDLDVVSMPIGAEVGALIVDVYKNGTKADIARARAGSRLRRGRGSVCARWGRRLGDLIEVVARNEGIEEISRKREKMVLLELMRHR